MEHLRPILSHFPSLDSLPNDVTITRLSGGLINDTFTVGDGWVLQRLHPIFGAEVNDDIVVLSAALNSAGVTVPKLLPSRTGAPFHRMDSGESEAISGVWRVMPRLAGRTLHDLYSPELAASAAQLIARFHSVLSTVSYEFSFSRPGAHDTVAHLAKLRSALTALPQHRLYDQVAALAERIDAVGAHELICAELPMRIGHGDLKVSNLLFHPQDDVATAVIDLDTMGWMTMDAELGDALRSWCNRSTEDAALPQLDETIFTAAIHGYGVAARGWMTAAEQASIVPGLLRITTELAARFAADALHETYFGWNPQLAPSRGAHNLMRANNQLQLAEQVRAARPRLERIVTAAFSS